MGRVTAREVLEQEHEVNAVNVPEIEKTLRLLVTEGSTFEVRALGKQRGRSVTLSGYFTDPSKAAKEISHACADMVGIYATMNPIRPELIARRAHRIGVAEKGETTSDHHVLRRTCLLIDIDGVPVSGISASDAEHKAAIALAAEMEDELARRGWPLPLRGDSGNGAHLDYRIDLPADDGGLVERVLHAAQARFGCVVRSDTGNITLKIDTTNKNPARITKIFGTPARKGDNVADRPHRLSKILAAPEQLVAVTREQLEAFANEYAPAAEPKRASRSPASQNAKTLYLDAWLQKHAIDIRTAEPWNGGTMYVLAVCPANADHSRGEAHVEQHASGAISAGCHHESCKWDWAWLRSKYDGDPESRRREPQAPKDELAARRERKRKPPSADDIADTGHAGLGPRGGYRLTDIGNARRFADANAHRLRFVRSWNQWLVWDGRRWKKDDLGTETAAAKQVVASIYADAAACAARAAQAINSGGTAGGDSVLEALTKHAGDSAKRARIEAMIALARSEPEIAASSHVWDADPWLLNTLNGTVDLRTGELYAHRQADLLTMLAPVEYDPNATCPRFEAFLERVQPDEEVRAWIQRYLGYALTGDVREQCIAFFYGGGSNGKSVLLDVVLNVLGDYGLRAAPDLVLAKHGEAHPTEVADLEARRLVVCSEIEQGRMWAESLIKRITGDQTIKARRMREDFYTFPATHKLVVAANTKPKVRGTDHGIWRRMKLVPWLVTIPDHEQDKTLPALLVAEEAAGIFTWLVRGCIAWQNRGLGSARAITDATKQYQDENDIIGRWIVERCELGGWESITALYDNFKRWCEEAERMQQSQIWSYRTWRERIVERSGIDETRKSNGTIRALSGIQLKGTYDREV